MAEKKSKIIKDYLEPKIERKVTSFRAKMETIDKAYELSELLKIKYQDVWNAALNKFYDDVMRDQKK